MLWRVFVRACLLAVLFFSIDKVAEQRADDTADDVCHVRNVVLNEDAADDLLADVDHGDQNKRQRDVTLLKLGKGGEQDKCKYDATCAAQRNVGKEQRVDQAGYKRCCENRINQCCAAILFLQHRPEQKQERRVAEEVLPAGVAENVCKQTQISKQTGKRGAVRGKQQLCERACADNAQNRCTQTGQYKCQNDRRIVFDFELVLHYLITQYNFIRKQANRQQPARVGDDLAAEIGDGRS